MKRQIVLICFIFLCLNITKAQTANEFYSNALTYKAKENYTEAARLLSKALALDPTNIDIKKELADVQYNKRSYYEAIPLYEEILNGDEKNLIYLARLSAMYSMSPKKMKSVEYADRALKLKPTDGEINKMLARSFLEIQHYTRAIKLYQEAEKSFPTDNDIPFKIAFCYAQIADYPSAMKYYKRALELDPDNATKLYEAANNASDAGNYKHALELYQSAEEKGYFKTTGFYANWANAYIELKDFNAALVYYAKAKELAPYDRQINFAIADIYSQQGDYKTCREILEQMLELNPNDAEVMYTIGMSYYKAGKTSKAEAYFSKAFELDPSLKSLRVAKPTF